MDLKNALLTDRVTGNHAVVELDGVGPVTVRGLTRYEMVLAGKITNELEQEQFILSTAMVDPQLTRDEVATWQRVSPPGEINEVATKVNELSGIGKGASKSDVPADGGTS